MLSPKFFKELKTAGEPFHQIAWKAGLKPAQLYRITSGIDRPEFKDFDKRVVALCNYLGLNLNEAFECDNDQE